MMAETSNSDRWLQGREDVFTLWVRRDLRKQFAITEAVPEHLLALIDDACLTD